MPEQVRIPPRRRTSPESPTTLVFTNSLNTPFYKIVSKTHAQHESAWTPLPDSEQ